MNTGDKKVRVCFRCEDKLSEWLVSQSEIIGVTPSAFVRQTLFGLMASQQKLASIMEKAVANETREVIRTAKAMNDEHDTDNKFGQL